MLQHRLDHLCLKTYPSSYMAFNESPSSKCNIYVPCSAPKNPYSGRKYWYVAHIQLSTLSCREKRVTLTVTLQGCRRCSLWAWWLRLRWLSSARWAPTKWTTRWEGRWWWWSFRNHKGKIRSPVTTLRVQSYCLREVMDYLVTLNVGTVEILITFLSSFQVFPPVEAGRTWRITCERQVMYVMLMCTVMAPV